MNWRTKDFLSSTIDCNIIQNAVGPGPDDDDEDDDDRGASGGKG